MKQSKKKHNKITKMPPAPKSSAIAAAPPLLIAAITLISIIIYSNTFRVPFQFDDQVSILGNAAVKDIGNPKAIFQFSPTRFIAYLTFACNYHFNSLNVFGYHAVNLIIHIFCSLLVMWFVNLTFATYALKDTPPAVHKKLISFFAALLFAVHPVQTQSVTYIVQRLASLATFFYLATLCLYIKGRLLQQSEAPRNIFISFLIGAAVAAVTGMLTKETVFTLPFAILLYEFYFFRSSFIYNWKFLAAVFAFCLLIPVTILCTGSIDFDKLRSLQEGPEGAIYISPLEYLFTQFRVLVTYLRLFILPVNQNLDYDYPVAHTFFSLQTMPSFFLLLLIAAAGFWSFTKHRLISFTIFWFFLTLSIESSLIPIRDVIFEHRLYLPMMGFSIFSVLMMYNLLWNRNRQLFYMFLSLIVIVYGTLTYARNSVWRNEITLWDDAIQKAPQKVRPHNNRGRAFGNMGEYDKAMGDFKQAILLNPRCAEAYYNLGLVYGRQGNVDKEIEYYNQAINIFPNYAAAYNNRGLAFANKKEFDRAIDNYEQALRITPQSPDVYYNRGLAHFYKKDFDQSIADYTRALVLNPRYANAYHNRAVAYYMKREYQKALDDVEMMQQFGFQVDVKLLKVLQNKFKGE